MQQLGLAGESTLRRSQLEGPQKVVGLLEVRAHSENLVHKIGRALNAVLGQSFGNNRVVGNGDALLVELAKATLVNELFDGGARGVTVGHVRLNQTKHTDGGLIQLDKGGVVQLAEAEKL